MSKENYEIRNISSDEKINHPAHYTSLRATCAECNHSIECIEIAKHFNFTLGNVIKYIWRSDNKGNRLEDLKKAKVYLEYEIKEEENKALKNLSSLNNNS